MNIQNLFEFKLKSLQRTTDDFGSALQSIYKYAPSLAVDDYGRPLPYVTQISLIGGEIVDFFDIKKHCKFLIEIQIFDNESQKGEYLQNHCLTN